MLSKIKWWRLTTFVNIQCSSKWYREQWICKRNRLCFPYYFWEAPYIYEKSSSFSIWFWGALNTLKGLQCLPFYFGKHCILKRSFQCLLFYLGEHCIFWKVANAYHFILGSTAYLCRVCLHLPFYHVWLRWRKSYNLFIIQIDHK